MRVGTGYWLALGLSIGALLASMGAQAGGDPSLAPLTSALTTAETDVQSMFPAISGILASVLLIGAAGMVIAVIVRR